MSIPEFIFQITRMLTTSTIYVTKKYTLSNYRVTLYRNRPRDDLMHLKSIKYMHLLLSLFFFLLTISTNTNILQKNIFILYNVY